MKRSRHDMYCVGKKVNKTTDGLLRTSKEKTELETEKNEPIPSDPKTQALPAIRVYSPSFSILRDFTRPLRDAPHPSITHRRPLLRQLLLPKRLPVLRPLIRHQPDHNQRNHTDTPKHAQSDRQHLQRLSRDDERGG